MNSGFAGARVPQDDPDGFFFPQGKSFICLMVYFDYDADFLDLFVYPVTKPKPQETVLS